MYLSLHDYQRRQKEFKEPVRYRGDLAERELTIINQLEAAEWTESRGQGERRRLGTVAKMAATIWGFPSTRTPLTTYRYSLTDPSLLGNCFTPAGCQDQRQISRYLQFPLAEKTRYHPLGI